MDKETLKNMPEYVKKLPKSIQDLIFEGSWEERTGEIAKKYSLNPKQTDTLINNVLFVLIGIDKIEDFLELMAKELEISKLLADQIIEDLEVRVFEYAVKTIENKERKETSSQQVASNNVSKTVIDTKTKTVIDTKIPEVRPKNLPMVEAGEVAHNAPLPQTSKNTPIYKPNFAEQNRTKNPERKEASHITYTPNNNPAVTPRTDLRIGMSRTDNSEQIQRPVPVPRFVGVKIDDAPVVKVDSVKIETPQNIVDNKLNIPTKTSLTPQTEAEKTKIPTPPKKYTTDPYREPLS